MAILPILTTPNPILKKVAKDVTTIDDAICEQVDNMLDTMYHDNGIGLAAPQIGISNRVIVVDIEQTEEHGTKNPIFLINPNIVWQSGEMNIYEEGCLSVPNITASIERPKEIKLEYLDRNGKEQFLEANGLLATCIQHEIDHLNGILFIDYLSKLKRNIITKKLKKMTKQKELI